MRAVVVHRIDHRRVVARRPPGEPFEVRRPRFRGADVVRVGAAAPPDLRERPEAVAHPAAREQRHPFPGRFDRPADGRPDPEEVVVRRRLAGADGDPPFAAVEIVGEVDGRVVDGKVLVVDGEAGEPGEVADGGRRLLRQRRAPGEVVGVAPDPAGELLRGVVAASALVGAHHELDGGEPVGVEDDERVGPEHVEDLATQPFEARHEGRFPAVVQPETDLPRQHDGRNVRENARAHDLAHDLLLPATVARGGPSPPRAPTPSPLRAASRFRRTRRTAARYHDAARWWSASGPAALRTGARRGRPGFDGTRPQRADLQPIAL